MKAGAGILNDLISVPRARSSGRSWKRRALPSGSWRVSPYPIQSRFFLTRPVIFNEFAKPLGQRGDLGLFDFSQYVIGLRQDLTIDPSADVGFSRDVMTFKVTIRIDGQPAIEAPYKLENGADSVSPFVTLEARS